MFPSLSPRRARWAIRLLLVLLVAACSDDTEGDGAGGTSVDRPLSFAADIHPILLAKCSGSSCHGVSMGPFRPGHANADVNEAYAQTQQIGLMQQPVYERILARTSSADPAQIMPPPYATPPCGGALGAAGCLGEDEFALIAAWVEQGAPP